MEYRELLNRGVTLILDPAVTDETANEFYAKYGGYLNEIALVAKHPSGYVFYNSSVANPHPDHRSFFSSYAKIGIEVGIRTYAYVNTLLDNTFGRDIQYRTSNVKGLSTEWYVCPSKSAFWEYLIALAEEITSFNPTGIVFTGNRFPRRDHCLCNDCRRAFAEYADIRLQFDYEEVMADPNLQEKWFAWRSKQMVDGFKRIVNAVWDINRDLDLTIAVDLEPEIGLAKGAYEDLGQNLKELAELTGHSSIHILPFSPILPKIGSADYNKFIDSAKFTEELKAKEYNLSLIYWGPVQDEEYDFIRTVNTELKADHLFVYPAYPIEYNEIRESHLSYY